MSDVHVGRERFLTEVEALLDHVGLIGFITELDFFLEVQFLLEHVVSIAVVPVGFVLLDEYFLDDHAVVSCSCCAIQLGGQSNMVEVP